MVGAYDMFDDWTLVPAAVNNSTATEYEDATVMPLDASVLAFVPSFGF